MRAPLVLLAIGSIAGGYVKIPDLVAPAFRMAAEHEEAHGWVLPVVASTVAILGIAIAFWMFVVRTDVPGRIYAGARGLARVLEAKWGFDLAYDWFASRVVVGGSDRVLWRAVDVRVIDGAVNGTAYATDAISRASRARPDGARARVRPPHPRRRGGAPLVPGVVAVMAGVDVLGWLVLLPALGALLLAFVPRESVRLQKTIALLLSTVVFVVSLGLLRGFHPVPGMQFEVNRSWIPSFGIQYHVGVDGLSLWLIILTTFLTPISLLASWSSIHARVKAFNIFMLLLEAGMLGVFVALDLFLFYIFWEAMLIPMYFLIGIWGHERRIYAAVKFFLFTMAGSVLMLVAFLVLYRMSGVNTFDLARLVAHPVAPAAQMWLFAAFALAFAIKVPMFPFHTWLPDAHVEAPTAGSVILAGVLLKMGGYGFLRFAFPLFPDAAGRFAPWIGVLAVIGIVYGALVSLVQPNMKKLVAYSSVSHLGFVMLGIAAFTPTAVVGVGLPDAEPRDLDGGALPHGRHALRPAAHLRDLGVRRAQGGDAVVLGHVPHDLPLVHRRPRVQRLRGRVPDPGGLLGHEPRPRVRGRAGGDPRRGIRPLDGAARDLRRGHEPRQPAAERPDRPRDRGHRAHGGAHAVHGGGEPALHPAHRALGAGPHRGDPRAGEGLAPRTAERARHDRPDAARSGGEGGGGGAMSALDLRPILPAAIVALTGVVVLLMQAFAPRGTRPGAGLSVVGLAAALASVVLLALGPGRGSSLGGTLVADPFALFLQGVLLVIGIVTVLLSPAYLRETALRGEYYALLLFAIVGMMGLVSSVELVALFVALEIMSVSVYAMAGLQRAQAESQEAAIKYFITGSFSSAFFLYGVALLYGLTGTTSLARMGGVLGGPARYAPAGLPVPVADLALVGVGLLLVGFGFKVAGVPFHQWAPDAYEGAPTVVTALMAAGVKAAAFGAFLRVFLQALPSLAQQWRPAVAVLAILTMIGGNLGALAQSNLKRMLAYSSIAHAGYLLTAFVAAPGAGTSAILFYLVAYAAVNLGGFGVLAALARDGREPLSLTDVAGLSERRPLLAAALTVYLISLTGVPVSAGFVGKFYLFSAAVNAGWTSLAIVGMVMSVVSAFYYLRVVVAMYFREPAGEDGWGSVGAGAGAALAFSVAVVLVLGVYPAPLVAWARLAAQSLP